MRNTDLATLAHMLQTDNARKRDVIVPGSALRMADDGTLVIAGGEPVGVNPDGSIVTGDYVVTPGSIFLEGIANRLDIPIRYVRRMADEHRPLLAQNVNAWLERQPNVRHMVRTFRNDEDAYGRAFLSDKFDCIDHLDVVLGVLDGVREVDPTAVVEGADIDERNMRLRITSTTISANVMEYVRNYAPDGKRGEDYPLLFAGMYVTNSETGNGAFTIGPRSVVQVCTNGQTRTQDALRRVHIGSRMDEGVIDWSTETRRQHVELIRMQAADAVRTFLSADMLSRFVADMAAAAGKAVPQPHLAVESVQRALSFSDTDAQAILAHFYRSGDDSALGLAQAITYVAQSLDDADLAAEAEDQALHLAVTLA